jgi:hypothetical protein
VSRYTLSPESLRILWRHSWARERLGDSLDCRYHYQAAVCLEARKRGDPMRPADTDGTGEPEGAL